jgi:ribosomal protein S18 acetylase RimI-like enzyme
VNATVRRVRADEWSALRDLRLRALADAPHAFSTSLADAQKRGDEEWQAIARKGASDTRWATFVAERDGRFLGMATGYHPDEMHRALDDPGVPSLIQMWVDPSVRREGVGTRLVAAVVDWAASGSPVVRLEVNSTDPGALSFYRSVGFHETGRHETMPDGRDATEMARPCRT